MADTKNPIAVAVPSLSSSDDDDDEQDAPKVEVEDVSELVNSVDQVARLVRTVEALQKRIIDLGMRLEVKSQALRDERKLRKEMTLRAAEMSRLLHQNDAGAPLDIDVAEGEDRGCGFPKFEGHHWGPGGLAQHELCLQAAIRTKHYAKALPPFVHPRPVPYSMKFEEHLVADFWLLALHRLVKDLPPCPTCQRKLRCMGVNPHGPRKMFTIAGPVFVVAYRYGCYTMENGKQSSKNGHTFLSYSGELLALVPEARRAWPIMEMSKYLISNDLLDALHMLYTTTACTLSQVQRTFSSLYSSVYVTKVAAWLTAVGQANRPGTLSHSWGGRGAPPPLELQHHNTFYDFLSVDTIRDLVLWRSRQLQRLQDESMTMKTGSVMSGDHVFSGLRLTIIQGHRTWKGMFTLHNEFNCVVLCVWVTDESYESLRLAFAALKRRFIFWGTTGVRIIYVDKCCGRGGFKDAVRSVLKWKAAEKTELVSKWMAVQTAEAVQKLTAQLELELEVKLDLAHSNGRIRKVLAFNDKTQCVFFESFRSAFWQLSPPFQGRRWAEVPQNYRCIPQPAQLQTNLLELKKKFEGHAFIDGESFSRAWSLLLTHVSNGCLSDSPGVDLALQTADGQTRTARSSSQNEGGHRKIKGACQKGTTCGTALTAGAHRAIYWRHNAQQKVRFFAGKEHPCSDILLLFTIRGLFNSAYPNLQPAQNPWSDCELPSPLGGPCDPLFDLYIHATCVPTQENERVSDATAEHCAALCLPLKLYVPDKTNRLNILPSPLGKFFAQRQFTVVESQSLLVALFNAILPTCQSSDDSETFTPESLLHGIVATAQVQAKELTAADVVACLETCSTMTSTLPTCIVATLLCAAALTSLAITIVSAEAHALVLIPPGGVVDGCCFLELRLVANFASLIPTGEKSERSGDVAQTTDVPLAAGTIRLAAVKTSNVVAMQQQGHVVVTSARTGNADRNPKEKWSKDEDEKLRKLMALHTTAAGRHQWGLVQRDWATASAEVGSVLRAHTTAQMTSHWQRLTGRAETKPVEPPDLQPAATPLTENANDTIPADNSTHTQARQIDRNANDEEDEAEPNKQTEEKPERVEVSAVIAAMELKNSEHTKVLSSGRKRTGGEKASRNDDADDEAVRKKKRAEKVEVSTAIAAVELLKERELKTMVLREQEQVAKQVTATSEEFLLQTICEQIEVAKEDGRMLGVELLDTLISFLFSCFLQKDVFSILPCASGAVLPQLSLTGTVLCPIYFKRHFVLVFLNRNNVEVYDSLRGYYPDAFEEHIRTVLSIGKEKKVEQKVGAGVQSEMSNDCAFFVCLNIQMLLQKKVIEVPKKGKSVDRCVILEKLRLHLIQRK